MLSLSCSWCHELNELREPHPTCWNCGHRADLPRALCDCPTCRQAVLETFSRVFSGPRVVQVPRTRSGWKGYERSVGRRVGAPRIPVTGRQGPGGDPGDLALAGFYTEVRDQKRPRPVRWMREVWEEARLRKRKPLLIFKGPAPYLSPLVVLRWADFAEVYTRGRPDRGARPDAAGPGAAVPGGATAPGS